MGYSHKRNVRPGLRALLARRRSGARSGPLPALPREPGRLSHRPLSEGSLLILSVAASFRRLHFFLVLGPNEASIHHGLTVVFKRHDCASERYFFVAIFPRLIVELFDAAF